MSSSQFSSLNPELHLLPKCRRLLHPPEPQGLQTQRSRQHLHLVVLTSKSLLQKSLDSEPQAALPHFLQHHRKNPFHEKNVLIVIVFKWTSRGCNVRSDWSVTWHHGHCCLTTPVPVYYFSCHRKIRFKYETILQPATFINIQTLKNEVSFVHFVSLLGFSYSLQVPRLISNCCNLFSVLVTDVLISVRNKIFVVKTPKFDLVRFFSKCQQGYFNYSWIS